MTRPVTAPTVTAQAPTGSAPAPTVIAPTPTGPYAGAAPAPVRARPGSGHPAQPSVDFTTSASRPATVRAWSMSAASTITRTSGSVPEGRSSTRPALPSSASAATLYRPPKTISHLPQMSRWTVRNM